MSELIIFSEHRFGAARGLVFFSPPYLMKRRTYEAVFDVLEELNLDVIECERDDVEMTRLDDGMRQVANSMRERLEQLGDGAIDFGMSLGAGFTALARKESDTKPKGRLILSPAPDPVTPWDEGKFDGFLQKANGDEPFVAGEGNYSVLEDIRDANMELTGKVPTHVIREKSRGMNDGDFIDDWGRFFGARTVDKAPYVHGTFKGRGELPTMTAEALRSLM